MKGIKDYIHLYIGCKAVSDSGIEGRIVEYNLEYSLCKIEISNSTIGKPISEIKPLLRPLSDMTEEEGYEIYFQYFGSKTAEDWSGDTGSAYFRPKKVQPGKYHGLRIVDGIDYSSGDFGTVIKILPFLLSKRFDLFGLINAGLAIDATKIKKP